MMPNRNRSSCAVCGELVECRLSRLCTQCKSLGTALEASLIDDAGSNLSYNVASAIFPGVLPEIVGRSQNEAFPSNYARPTMCSRCGQAMESTATSSSRDYQLCAHCVRIGRRGPIQFAGLVSNFRNSRHIGSLDHGASNAIPYTGLGAPSRVRITDVAGQSWSNIDQQQRESINNFDLTMFDSPSTHTADKPHECEFCQKRFAHLSKLNSHRRTHTGEKPYECEFCQERFAQSNNLNRHQRTHTGEKPYQCEFCQERFAQLSNLNVHRRTHTGEKPYQCEFCQERFAQRGELNSHRRTHTGEKPFKCGTCDMAFAHNSTLTTHLRTHTGEKPYECHICHKRFTQWGNLNEHRLIHASKKPHI